MLRDMNALHTAEPQDITAASVVLSIMVKAGVVSVLLDWEIEGHSLFIHRGVDSQTRQGQQRALPVQGHAMVPKDGAQHLLQPRQTRQAPSHKRVDVGQERPLCPGWLHLPCPGRLHGPRPLSLPAPITE
jgi:hypothetical protein